MNKEESRKYRPYPRPPLSSGDRKSVSKFFLRNLKGKNVLLYVSATDTFDEYRALPFDYIILNSNHFRIRNGIQLVHDKILEIPYDNNRTLKLLRNFGVKIQCFIGIQDGCCEGGNYECVNTPQFFGRLSPILENKVMYITNHWDYNSWGSSGIRPIISRRGFYNCHYEKVEITDDMITIPKSVPLSTYESALKNRIDIAIARIKSNTIEGKIGNITIKVSHTSVWDLESKFDCIIHPPMSSENKYLSLQKRRAYRSLTEYAKDPKRILEDANEHKWENVGLVPFLLGRYGEFLTLCEQWNQPYPKSLHFCHMHDFDLEDLKVVLLKT